MSKGLAFGGEDLSDHCASDCTGLCRDSGRRCGEGDEDRHYPVCTRYGELVEFAEHTRSELEERAAVAGRFKTARHRLEFSGICQGCQSAGDALQKKAALMRGSFIHFVRKRLYHFLLPVSQMQILLHFSAFVAVFEWFLGLMIQFAKGMLWIPDSLRDDFHHSFHITTLVVELAASFAFLAGDGRLRTLLSIRLFVAFVIQILPDIFVRRSRTTPNTTHSGSP